MTNKQNGPREETARALWRHLRRRDDVEATLHLERLLVDVSRRHQQLRDDVDRLVVSHNRLRQQQVPADEFYGVLLGN